MLGFLVKCLSEPCCISRECLILRINILKYFEYVSQVIQVVISSQKAAVGPIFLMVAKYQFLGWQFLEFYRSFLLQHKKLQFYLYNFVLVVYCCLANHSKTQWSFSLINHFIMLTNFESQEFRHGIAEWLVSVL